MLCLNASTRITNIKNNIAFGCWLSDRAFIRIFDPFFSTKDPGEGTGVGLATIFQILQKMSRRIEVRTQPQEGTTFSIYIPRYTDKKKKLPDSPPGPSASVTTLS